MKYLACVYRPSTGSSLVFEMPEAWGEFDFSTAEAQIAAGDLIKSEFNGYFLPHTYAIAVNEEAVAEYREKMIESLGDTPNCSDIQEEREL